MAEFEPILTQEAFDAAISQRIRRERETVRKEFADYDQTKAALSEAQKKNEEHEASIAELQKKIQGYETDSVKTRIALEKGIPLELRDRLTGTTEEEIRADADTLVKFLSKSGHKAPPLRDPEPVETDAKKAASKAAYKKLFKDLNSENN